MAHRGGRWQPKDDGGGGGRGGRGGGSRGGGGGGNVKWKVKGDTGANTGGAPQQNVNNNNNNQHVTHNQGGGGGGGGRDRNRGRGGGGRGRPRKTEVDSTLDKKRKEDEFLQKKQEEEQRQKEAERKRQEEEEAKKRREIEEQERKVREEEERKKREEEERELEKKRLEEAQLAREAEAKARAQEAKKAREDLVALRKANLNPTYPGDSFFKTLDSNMKKNTAFIKKVSTISEKTKDKLCAEMQTLNLTRYVSEVVTAIAEAKLKTTDVGAVVQLCSLMHQRYSEFQKLLIPAFTRVFEPQKGEPEAGLLVRKRTTLRLLTELFLAGVYSDAAVLYNILKDLVKVNKDNILRAEVDSKERENLLSVFHHQALLVTGFIRSCGEAVLGIIPEKKQRVYDEAGIEAAFVVVAPEQQKQFLNHIKNFFGIAKDVLIDEHKNLRQVEAANHRILQTRGELSEAEKASYEKIRKSYERFQTCVSGLCELLNEEMPVLQEDDNKTRIADDPTQNKPKEVKSNEPEPIFDDEDTRSFYEDLPQLRVLVPAVLFGDTDPKSKKKEEGKEGKEGGEEGAKASVEGESQPKASKPTEGSATKKEEEGNKAEEDDNEKKGKAASSSTSGDKTSAGGVTLEELLSRLPNCVNRDLIDKAAIDFCYINSKGNRKKLIKTVFNVPRTQLVLLPYYARLIATLSQCMKDVGPMLISMLEEEFNFLLKKKDQMNIETKIKNIKFLGELVKFKVASHNLIFTCLKECLDDFVHHNIDVCCALLETCGRFLYRTPETHVRAKNMLDIMMRLKNIKNLDNRLDTIVENAYYQCIPPDRPARKEKKLPPIVRYINKLVFYDLNKHTVKHVMKQLRKVPWGQYFDVVLEALLRVHKGKYSNIHVVASLVAGLFKYHEDLGVKLVDRLIEEIRYGMEVNAFRMQQRRIAYVKFLGELYNYLVIGSSIIFDALYTFITFGADDVTMDPPDDCFRIRMICTLLDTCGKYFDRGSSKKRLDRFLVYFQRYYLAKEYIPLDVEFMISDCFDAIRPKYTRILSFEDALKMTDKIEADEKEQGIFPTGPTFISHVIDIHSVDKPRDNNDDDDEDEESEDEDDNEEDIEEEEDEESYRRGLGKMKADDPRAALFTQAVSGAKRGGLNELDEEELHFVKPIYHEEAKNEEEEFDRELKKMMRESVEARKLENRNFSLGNMTVPMELYSSKDKKPEESEKKDAMPFRVLVRKGNKQQVRNVDIPLDCSLAVKLSIQKAEEQREHQEIKRRTLEAYDDGQDEEMVEEVFGNIPVVHIQKGPRLSQKARKQQQMQQGPPPAAGRGVGRSPYPQQFQQPYQPYQQQYQGHPQQQYQPYYPQSYQQPSPSNAGRGRGQDNFQGGYFVEPRRKR